MSHIDNISPYRYPYRYHIHVRYPISISHIGILIDITFMSDLQYRYPISISHIDLPIISCHCAQFLPDPTPARWERGQNTSAARLYHRPKAQGHSEQALDRDRNITHKLTFRIFSIFYNVHRALMRFTW